LNAILGETQAGGANCI